MIRGLTEERFARLMAEHFTPAQPISKIEHLFGRDKKNREIQRAFASPGKHVFVFGDRGVGKTSLAKTAAAVRANCDVKLVPFVSCDQGSSFYDTCGNIFREILRVNPKLLDNLKVEANIDVWFFKLSGSKQVGSDSTTGTATTVHEVADRLRQLTRSLTECLVVIDEFDQIASQVDRKLFADLIKQVSDREIPVRFVITGIGRSLEELIGVHLSTDRYLAPIALEPIPHDARWQIIDGAAAAMGISIPRVLGRSATVFHTTFT
jgi:Cdc6-like AAA superfamily ATPase